VATIFKSRIRRLFNSAFL